MSDLDDRAERHGRILAELAEIGMQAARTLSEALEDARTVVDKERLALSLHRISRDVRLTLALEERLVHERRKALREERADRQRAVEHRKKQVDHAVIERIYAEREDEEADSLIARLADLVDEHRLYAAFLERPLEAVITELCKQLGLKPPAANDTVAAALLGQEPQARAGPS